MTVSATPLTLDAVINACVIHSPTAVQFGDLGPLPVPPAQPPATPNGEMPDPLAPLKSVLADILYTYAYARPTALSHGVAATATRLNTTQPTYADPAFVEQIMSSCDTEACWDAGWVVFSLDQSGTAHVSKGTSYRHAQQGQYVLLSAAPVAAGSEVALPVRKGDPVAQPGFIHMFGAHLSSEYDAEDLVRIYLNPDPMQTVEMVAAVTQTLNGYHVPFQMKVLSAPSLYDRADGGVIYFGKRYLDYVLRLMDRVFVGDAPFGMRPDVPLFSCVYKDGIGLAEDPANGQSFGQSRCSLVAAGLVDAWSQGKTTPDSKRACVEAQFTAAGLDPEKPYLRAGNRDLFRPAIIREGAAA